MRTVRAIVVCLFWDVFPVLLNLFRMLCRYIRNYVDDPFREEEVLCCQLVREYLDVLVINEVLHDCGAFIGL